MTIDECITQYEAVGKSVFGKRPSVWRKFLQGMISWPFYDITVLQDEVKRVLYTHFMTLRFYKTRSKESFTLSRSNQMSNFRRLMLRAAKCEAVTDPSGDVVNVD